MVVNNGARVNTVGDLMAENHRILQPLNRLD
jgi:hypothetical protein